MSLKKDVDGREATKIVLQYFTENYGSMGVNLFEIERIEYHELDKSWTVTCSFFRSLGMATKSYYRVDLNSNGKLGSVNKIAKPSE